MRLDWRGWTPGQWALRGVMVLGPLLALYARSPSLGAPPVWLAVLVLVLALGWAMVPESAVGVVVLLLVGWTWAAADAGTLPVGALPAAAGLLAAHLAALVVGYGPGRLPVPASVVRLWARRGLVLLVPAGLAWALGHGVEGLSDSPTVWVVGLGVAVSVVVVAVAALQAVMPAGRGAGEDDR